MNNLNKNIRLVIVYFLFIQCATKHKVDIVDSPPYEYVETFKLASFGNKEIELDSLTDPYKNNVYLSFDNNIKLLFLSSDLDNSLQRYNWDSGKIIDKKKLPREGPNGVGNVNTFFVENKDSIYLLSSYTFKLSLVNSNYDVIRSYSLIPTNESKMVLGRGMFPIGKQFAEFGCFNDKIIIGGQPFMDKADRKFYSEGITSLQLNKSSGEMEYLTTEPDTYIDRYDNGYRILGQNSSQSQTFNYRKNLMIISHRTESFIEVIDLKTKEYKKVYAGGLRVKEIPWVKKGLTDDEEFKFFTKSAYFSSIRYDKYRDVYYRLLETPNPKKLNYFDGKLWTVPSVIILNADFKKIGETFLPSDYSMSTIIITEEGLYLKKFDEREDRLVFTLFKLQKT